MPSVFDNRYQTKSADLYIDATDRILALFKEDKNHFWDLRSIQQKLGFVPSRPDVTLDDSEIQFLLDTLVNFGYIDVTENENTFGSEKSLYYRLAYNYLQPDTWFQDNLDSILLALLVGWVSYEMYRLF